MKDYMYHFFPYQSVLALGWEVQQVGRLCGLL